MKNICTAQALDMFLVVFRWFGSPLGLSIVQNLTRFPELVYPVWFRKVTKASLTQFEQHGRVGWKENASRKRQCLEAATELGHISLHNEESLNQGTGMRGVLAALRDCRCRACVSVSVLSYMLVPWSSALQKCSFIPGFSCCAQTAFSTAHSTVVLHVVHCRGPT